MTGMRVLDIEHAEGFFCFEAERRGQDHRHPRFRPHDPEVQYLSCRPWLESPVVSRRRLRLDPRTLGTFDVVFFFGVLCISATRFWRS